MPIYEYRCQLCGHELEKLQRMNDQPLTDCPACEKSGLKRLISAAGFRLKGAGWYETDFKKDNRRNLADDGKKPDSKDSAASKDSKGDTPKTESKKTTKPADSKPAGKSGTSAA